MSKTQAQSNDELEIAEAQNSLVDLLYDYAAKGITTRIGQFVYRRVDSFLSIAEKTARWSLPQPAPSSDNKGPGEPQEDGKMHISPPPLIRPLPWLLFIPALIYMRLIRSGLSLMALIMGWRPLLPEHVVSWLQNKRRKLRALKYRGQKLERINRAEQKASNPNDNEPKTTWLSKITLPWKMVICSRGYGRVPSTVVVRRPHRHQHYQKDSTEGQKSKKRNVEQRDLGDSSSEDSMEDAENCQELLNREYANDGDDSSFHVSDGSSDSSDSFISETEKSTVEDESSKETEPKSAKKQSKEAQNGHAKQEKSKSNGNAVPAEDDQKPNRDEEQKPRKSSLNVENGDEQAKPEENGTAEPSKPSSGGKNVHSSNRSKSAASLESDHSEASRESKSSKSTPNLTPSAEGQEDIENKPQNQNTTDKQMAGSMSEVKSNMQQKQKHHQHQSNQNPQQQQHQNPQQQQQQQHQQNQHQQHATVNGGGKKHKRPSHGH